MATLATKAITLVVPAGYALHTVTTWSSGKSSDPTSVYYGRTLANADQVIYKTTTEVNGYTVSVDADGYVSLTGGSNSDNFKFRHYSSSAWTAELLWYKVPNITCAASVTVSASGTAEFPAGALEFYATVDAAATATAALEAVGSTFAAAVDVSAVATPPTLGDAPAEFAAAVNVSASASLDYSITLDAAATATASATAATPTFTWTLGFSIAAPAGWALHTVSSTAQQGNLQCIYFGQTVAIGNQVLYKTSSENLGYAVSVDSDGLVALDGVGADDVKFRIYNGSSWSAELTFAGPRTLPVAAGVVTVTAGAVTFARTYGAVQILLTPPAGWAVLEVGSIEQAGSSTCIYYGHTVAPGDQVVYKTTTDNLGLAVEVDSRGMVSTQPSGVDTLAFRIFSQATGTWSAELQFQVVKSIRAAAARVRVSAGVSNTDYLTVVATKPILFEVPPGLLLHSVTDVSRAGVSTCLYYGLGLAVGSRIMLDAQTELFGWPVTIDEYGFPVIHSDGRGEKDWFRYRVWDVTDSTWSAEVTFAVSAIVMPQVATVAVTAPAVGLARSLLFAVDPATVTVTPTPAVGGKQALLFANVSAIAQAPSPELLVPIDTFNVVSVGTDGGRIYNGQVVRISGTAFGLAPGTVKINGVTQAIVTWTNRYVDITVNVPSTGFYNLEMEKAA